MAPTLRARIYSLLRYTDPSPAARRWRATAPDGARHRPAGGGPAVDRRAAARHKALAAGRDLVGHRRVLPGIPRAALGGAGDLAFRPAVADHGPRALGDLRARPDRTARRPAGGHAGGRLRHHRLRHRVGVLHPLGPQARPARARLRHARPRRIQRARADRQRADPVRHRPDARRHRRPPAGARAPARAVRQPAGRDVVGGRHAHHDGLRRRRAAHGRRHA